MTLPGSQANQFIQHQQAGELAYLNKTDVAAMRWNTFTISSNTQAVVGGYYTMTASLMLTLPLNPLPGERVAWYDASGTRTGSINPNGRRICTDPTTMILDTEYTRQILTYVDDTQGWV